MRLECHNNLWSMFIFGECLCAAVAATAQVSTIGEHKVSIGAQLTQPNHAYTLNTWSHVDHTNSYINSNEAEWAVYRTSFWDSLFSTACIAHKNSPSKKRKIVILRTLHICTPYELSNCICAQTVIPCNGETKTERTNGPAQIHKMTRATKYTKNAVLLSLSLSIGHDDVTFKPFKHTIASAFQWWWNLFDLHVFIKMAQHTVINCNYSYTDLHSK